MIDAIRTATSGLLAASRQFDTAAGRVARTGTSPNPAGSDLASASADLVSARAQVRLNAATLKVADDVAKRLLDVRA
ncbi:hypothetical protein [Methylobacterium tarhaniae]|uniref:hypothetical protein n=1 Tax=Methylobacterium tarhaniae TaxID=1187852 RepID=UPI003CFF2741